MTTYTRPIFISEEADPDHTLTDCVWCAGLMQANAAQGGIHPATLSEAELLENAAGGPFPLGSTSQELVAGTTKRYGWAATIEDTPAAILSALQPGRGATVSGKPGLLPDTSPFRKFTGTGDYGHRVYIEVTDGPTYWLMDPLAPPNAGYVGQQVTLADIKPFAALGSGGTIAPLHVTPAKYTVHIDAGPVIVYSVNYAKGGCITGYVKTSTGSTTQPCTAPAHRVTCAGSSGATTVKVLGGVFAQKIVKIGGNVTVTT